MVVLAVAVAAVVVVVPAANAKIPRKGIVAMCSNHLVFS